MTALPKIKFPIFDAVLPYAGTRIKFRPFLVKEEKLLLLAAQTNTPKDIANVVKQILQNCIVAPEMDAGKLSALDAEYLFIKIRAKSVNNLLELKFKDPDGKSHEFEIDLEELEVTRIEGHEANIQLDDNVGITLSLPTVDDVIYLLENNVDIEQDKYAIARQCITQVYTKDEVIDTSSTTDKEWDEWIEGFTPEAKAALDNFFATAPKLIYEHKYTMSDGQERTVTLQGLADFFQFA
jgi:hypothetical protein